MKLAISIPTATTTGDSKEIIIHRVGKSVAGFASVTLVFPDGTSHEVHVVSLINAAAALKGAMGY